MAKVLELQHQPSNEYSGLISFRINWFDLLAVQGTLKALQDNSFKSINSLVLSVLYGPTLTYIHDYWKNHSLTMQSFVGKVMSLLFNMLSRFVIAFFPRSKCLLISWLQSPSSVILEPKKIKSVSDGTRCHDLVFCMLSFKPSFPLYSFTLFRRFFSSSLSVRVV